MLISPLAPLYRSGLLASLALVAALLVLAGARGREPDPDRVAPVDESVLREGDLLFRRGESLHSRAVLFADAASKYSHVGVVVRLREGLAVVHVLPAGDDAETGRVQVDPLAAFLPEEMGFAWAVLRATPVDPQVAAAAAGEALEMAAAVVRFDAAFDRDDAESLYCTELAWLAYRRAGLELVTSSLPRINVPLAGVREVILPSALLASRRLTVVARSGVQADEA